MNPIMHRTLQAGVDWTPVTIGDICEPPQYGYTASAEWEPVGPQMLRITDVQNGTVNWAMVPFCRCPNPERYKLKQGDILFARTGATTGKSYLVEDCPNAVFASYLIRLRVKKMVLPEFLYWFFQSPQYWQQIIDQRQGTGQPNVNGSKLERLQLRIPPLDEQRRVVTRIERIQERFVTVNESLGNTVDMVRRLLSVSTDFAFRGQLSHAWRQEHPEEDVRKLLERICQTNKVEQDRGQALPIFRTDFTDGDENTSLHDLPSTWCWVRLGELIGRIEAGKSPKAEGRPAGPGETGVLKVSAVSWGEFRPEENKALPKGYPLHGLPRVQAGDLLISRANTPELVGAVVLVESDYPNLVLSDKTLRLVPKTSDVRPDYLLYALRTRAVRNLFEQATGTSDSMRNLSQEKILQAPIALAPLSEQEIIVDELKTIGRAARKTLEKVAAAQEQTKHLLKALLADLFAGSD